MKKVLVLGLILTFLLSSFFTTSAQGGQISSFTTSATAVDRNGLAGRTSRVPVSWTTNVRPDGSNLVF